LRRGEVWLLNLEPTVGSEIRKTRPVVIVSDDTIGTLALKVIVPVTEWKNYYAAVPWMVKLTAGTTSGLDKPSAADTFQVRSVAQERFIRKLGHLPDATMQQISRALKIVLQLD